MNAESPPPPSGPTAPRGTPPPVSAPTASTPPKTIDDIVNSAQAYIDGKTPKRGEIAAFMQSLLDVLSAPIVMKPVAEVDPTFEQRMRESLAHPVFFLDNGVPELDKLERGFAGFVNSQGGVEPSLTAGPGAAVYLPPEVNQRYTPREVRILCAKMLSLAHQVETSSIR